MAIVAVIKFKLSRYYVSGVCLEGMDKRLDKKKFFHTLFRCTHAIKCVLPCK